MLDSNRIKGFVGTIIFHGLLLVVLLLCGFSTPLPLPAEAGMEVNFGDSDEGMGNTNPDQLSASTPQPTHQTSSPDDSYYQSNDDESVNLNQRKPTPSNTPQRPTQEITEPQPTLNPNAIYRPGNKPQGGSEGITGNPGNQGKPNGTLDATSYTGDGTGKGSGNGSGKDIDFSLSGRKASVLPKPDNKSNEQGKVIVKIWVDRTGKVIKAQAGEEGTIAAASLWRIAEQAALQAKFSADPEAADPQTGTITYIFLKLN